MALTAGQKATIKSYIQNTPALASQPNSNEGNQAIAGALNANASPDVIVWRTSLDKHDVTDRTSETGTTFSWPGYIVRSQGERDCWNQLWNSTLSCNPSLSQVRQGFSDIFSGNTTEAQNNRAHMLAMAKRKATVVESLFVTGTGSTGSPAVMSYEGPVSVTDVEEARNA